MIVDTNVIVSILMEPSPSKFEFIKKANFQAPMLLKIELLNVLRKFHFLNNLTKENAFNYYEQGVALIDEFYNETTLLPYAIEISFTLNHPIYDCIYLALAQYLNAPFLSIDKKLLAKANKLGIEVIDFDII